MWRQLLVYSPLSQQTAATRAAKARLLISDYTEKAKTSLPTFKNK